MKILLYCPLNPKPPRAYAATVQSIFAQEWAEPLDVMFGRNDTAGDKLDDLERKHNEIRDLALQGGYDAVLMVEADMIIPPDALARLAAVDADVAYGLYCSRHGSNQWLAFTELGKNSGKSIDRNRRFCAEQWGKVIPTVGVGMGCTLIKRHVLEAITFRHTGGMADDWQFSLDCQYLHFTQAHDLGVVCGHITGAGMAIWPQLGEKLYRVEAYEHPGG